MTFNAATNASYKDATTFVFDYDAVDVAYTIRFDQTNWSEGVMTNLSVADLLRPDSATGGTWFNGILLSEGTTGIHVNWAGLGVTLEYSTNGTSWSSLPSGTPILESTASADGILHLRATLANDTSYLEYINLIFMNSNTLRPFNGVGALTFRKAYFVNVDPFDAVDSGAILDGGFLVYDIPDEEPSIKSVELWAMLRGAGNGTLLQSGTATVSTTNRVLAVQNATVYINGVARAAGYTLPSDVWLHIVVVLNTATLQPITIANNTGLTSGARVDIAHLAFYASAFSAQDADLSYRQGLGTAVYRVIDDNSITVTEATPAVDIYAYYWTNSG